MTGTILGMCDVDAGTDTTVGGVREWRDWTVTCRESMSDPRVSGLSEHHYNRDCRYSIAPGDTDDVSPIGCVTWSDFVVTGPDGTWVGADRGFVTADGEIDTYRVATGTGAYAGWTYVSHADESHVSGIIYEGQPPPWPSAPAVHRRCHADGLTNPAQLTDGLRRVAHASPGPGLAHRAVSDAMVIAPVVESMLRGNFVSGLGAGPDTTRASWATSNVAPWQGHWRIWARLS